MSKTKDTAYYLITTAERLRLMHQALDWVARQSSDPRAQQIAQDTLEAVREGEGRA